MQFFKLAHMYTVVPMRAWAHVRIFTYTRVDVHASSYACPYDTPACSRMFTAHPSIPTFALECQAANKPLEIRIQELVHEHKKKKAEVAGNNITST